MCVRDDSGPDGVVIESHSFMTVTHKNMLPLMFSYMPKCFLILNEGFLTASRQRSAVCAYRGRGKREGGGRDVCACLETYVRCLHESSKWGVSAWKLYLSSLFLLKIVQLLYGHPLNVCVCEREKECVSVLVFVCVFKLEQSKCWYFVFDCNHFQR